MEKIRTSFSNSGNLLKVQYTGLVGFGCLQLAMNCVKHSQYGFIIIFHLLSRQLYSRDCMKVYETHTKVLARKISDVSIQQLKKRNKNKKKNKFFQRLGIHRRAIMGQPGCPHIVAWDVWQDDKLIFFQLVTQSFIGEDCVTSQRSICLGDFRVKQHPLASLWQCGYPLYHYSLTGWITLCHCKGK